MISVVKQLSAGLPQVEAGMKDTDTAGAADTRPGRVERALARHVERTGWDDIPAGARDYTRICVLDAFGSAIAGVKAEGCEAIAALVQGWGGAAQAHVIGSGAKVPAHHAALANATMARALEIDDAHEQAMSHLTASMAPIALAVAESRGGISGRDFLAAVVLGNDLAIRIAVAPRADVSAGRAARRTQSHTYHVGSLVGALVAGKVRGFDALALQNALGIAYSQCAGNLQGVAEGALTVRAQQGLSSMAGVVAADLAGAGITGALESLTGPCGYYAALHGGRYDAAVLTDRLGEYYTVQEISIKPYPCCRHIHTAAAAAEQAIRDHAIRPEEVEKVTLRVLNREYFDVVCTPLDKDEHRAAILSDRGWVHAQMSMPFVVAAAFCDGRVRLDRFADDRRRAPDLVSMFDRVEAVLDTSATGNVLPTPGIVEVRLRGRAEPVTARVDYAHGHPENPMSFDDVAAKFMDMTEFAADRFSRDRRLRIIEAVQGLERVEDMREIGALLVADR